MISVFMRVQNLYDSFTKAEKRVAKFILDNYTDIEPLTLAELSKQTGSGEATIVRLCGKIGLDSFKDLKALLRTENRSDYFDNPSSYPLAIKNTINENLQYVLERIDPDMLNKIAALLFKAGKIMCAGIGNSGFAAKACAMRLLRNGKNGIYIEDPHFQSMYINEMTEKDAAVLFSVGGETYDTVHSAKFLHAKKVPVIGVTSSVVSSLAKECDYHLLMRHSVLGPMDGGSMTSQISQMYIADVLTTAVALIDKQKVLNARKYTYEYIAEKQSLLPND